VIRPISGTDRTEGCPPALARIVPTVTSAEALAQFRFNRTSRLPVRTGAGAADAEPVRPASATGGASRAIVTERRDTLPA
jgi:hypothetical protein